jgi:hypothetical protein
MPLSSWRHDIVGGAVFVVSVPPSTSRLILHEPRPPICLDHPILIGGPPEPYRHSSHIDYIDMINDATGGQEQLPDRNAIVLLDKFAAAGAASLIF